MIQTYENLRSQINILNNKFEGQVFIQKIYSTAYYLCFSIRGMGKSQYLYIGRGSGHEGIWLGEEKPEPFLRKRDTFLEYIRKHLSSTTLEGIELDSKDRIVCIHYFKWGRKNSFRFFYLGRKLYFSNHFFDPKKKEFLIYKSWDKRNYLTETNDFSCFDEVGRKKINQNTKESEIIDISKILEKESELASANKVKAKKYKFLERKLKNIEKDFEKINKWVELFEIANKEEDFSKYDKKTKISGVKFNFSFKDHFKRRDEVFQKVKNFKKAEIILKSRLEKTRNEIQLKSVTSDENKLEPIKPYWNSKKIEKASIEQIKEDGFKILKKDGFQMAIGLSSSGNDELRKNWAKKDDVWFHMDGDKSSHIIIKLGNNQLDSNIFQIIGSAMLDFSKFEYTEVNLIYTQVKNLKGVPGVSGSVNYKKEKRIRIEKNSNWMDFFSN